MPILLFIRYKRKLEDLIINLKKEKYIKFVKNHVLSILYLIKFVKCQQCREN